MPETPSLEVTYLPVRDLVPYANNSKIHTEEQIAQIASSIERFGDCDPIGVWHDPSGKSVIVEGHGRMLALEQLGIDEAPVIFLDHLSDEDRRAYSHVHNQTTLSSGLDEDILAADLEELGDLYDWEALGFEVPSIGEAEEIEDAPIPEKVETRTKAGDLWRMGDHVLLCGDSGDPENVPRLLKAVGGGSADMLLTDPPYNVAYDRRGEREGIANDEFKNGEAYVEFLTGVLAPAATALRAGGSFYVWHASTENVVRALEALGLPLRQILVWVKNVFVMGRQDYQWRHELCAYGWKPGAPHRFFAGRNVSTIFDDEADLEAMTREELLAIIRETPTDVLRYARPARSAEHPTMKPVPLFARLIANSTEPGEIVLDPFGGAGTTALACEHMGRRAALIELDPAFCDATLARWEELTGREAERI